MRLAAGPVAVLVLLGCGSTASSVRTESIETVAGADATEASTTPETVGATVATPQTTSTVAETTVAETTVADTTVPDTTPETDDAGVFTIPQATIALTIPPGDTQPGTAAPATTRPGGSTVSTTADGAFLDTDGGFSVAFGGTPTEHTIPVGSGSAVEHLYEFATSAIDQALTYVDVPGSQTSTTVLNSAVDGTVRAASLTVVSRSTTTYQGQPAIDFEATGVSSGTPVRFFGRAVVAGKRLYIVAFAFPASDDRAAEAHQFLDSFKLLGS